MNGNYRIECYGAVGGGREVSGVYTGGLGGYSSTEITVTSPITLYVYVGGKGEERHGGWNGGGNSSLASSVIGYGGGGATDVRTTSGNFDDTDSLMSRIIVAGRWRWCMF